MKEQKHQTIDGAFRKSNAHLIHGYSSSLANVFGSRSVPDPLTSSYKYSSPFNILKKYTSMQPLVWPGDVPAHVLPRSPLPPLPPPGLYSIQFASGSCCPLDSRSSYTCSAPQPASASLDRTSDPVYPAKSQQNLPHIRWWLDAGHKFKNNVAKTNEGNDRSRGVLPPLVPHADATDEEIDCRHLESKASARSSKSTHKHRVQRS